MFKILTYYAYFELTPNFLEQLFLIVFNNTHTVGLDEQINYNFPMSKLSIRIEHEFYMPSNLFIYVDIRDMFNVNADIAF